MELNGQNLDTLYVNYGFRKRKSTNKDVRVFTFRSGYFNNADIVPLTPDADTDNDFEQFRKSGFACKVRAYQCIEDAELRLFEGFFALDSTRTRLFAEEERFRYLQGELLGTKYKYISPPYSDIYSVEKNNAPEPLVDRLIQQISSDGPQLIILEAAAGYGKTCTSFEVLERLLSAYKNKIPFLIELSRNRQAKIFRYVLLDEIDRFFPSLSADLVQSQISNGNLILIIDGFDELLHRTESLSSDYDQVEPMLETISDLLKGQAKIILTTRRTAIFSGDHFHQWIENHEEDFTTARYSILKPNIDDWFPYERRELFKQEEFPIHHLSNPVLLAFLAGQSDSDFNRLATHPESIVQYYFDRILERETERQELRMEPAEQYKVFTNLACHMIEADFTAEDHEYLQMYIEDANKPLLTQIRNRYPADKKPTLDELSTKLVSHAFMDRKGDESDRVGFVNDFVLGNFIGECAFTSESNEWVAAEGFIEQAVASYATRSKDDRERLWKILEFALNFLPIEQRIHSDILLMSLPQRSLVGETLNGLQEQHTSFGTENNIKDSVFSNCIFNDITFDLNNFINITFVGCKFFECEYVFDETNNTSPGVFLVGCSGDIEKLSSLIENEAELEDSSGGSELETCEKQVLEQFWPVGRSQFTRRKKALTLYRGHSNTDRHLVTRAIQSLQKKDLIFSKDDTVELNLKQLPSIKRLLKRVEQ